MAPRSSSSPSVPASPASTTTAIILAPLVPTVAGLAPPPPVPPLAGTTSTVVPVPSPPPPHRLSPVPELPADLGLPTTSTSTGQGGEHDDHQRGVTIASADDVAAAWAVERYTARADDPPGDRRARLAAIAAHPALAAEVDASAPRPRDGGAMWAVVTTQVDLGGGWWNVALMVKETATGQVGVASTPVAVHVHVTGQLVVDQERAAA